MMGIAMMLPFHVSKESDPFLLDLQQKAVGETLSDSKHLCIPYFFAFNNTLCDYFITFAPLFTAYKFVIL